MESTIICFDLKSFFASVECVERNLDPMNVNLVVADNSRTDKTICLAVSPALKSLGVPGRPRLFEVNKCVQDLNKKRYRSNSYKKTSKSYFLNEINNDPSIEVDFIIAPPRMAYYIEYSTRIYNVYLKYFAPEDIHVYSIDEVFIDATNYMKLYKLTPYKLAEKIINDIFETTKIIATSGIGTNLYLAKVAMDIVAKKLKLELHEPRIAYLNEEEYKKQLWDHKPLTDFWRIGNGISSKLALNQIFTMGDIARCSLGSSNQHHNEALLYRLFGINAELLIDHSWGIETASIKDIKSYKPVCHSLSSGQVLHKPYTKDNARIVLREMIDALTLDLVEKNLVTDLVTLFISYDNSNLTDSFIREKYDGDIVLDAYGRKIPKGSSGSVRIAMKSSSELLLSSATIELFDSIANPLLYIRKLNIAVNNLVKQPDSFIMTPNQLNLFDKVEEYKDYDFNKENSLAKAMVNIKNKHGKNAVLKLSSLSDDATAKERNEQIGGHKA